MSSRNLDQLEVRQAIAALIAPLITERVYKKQAEPIYSIVPTNFEAYQRSKHTVTATLKG